MSRPEQPDFRSMQKNDIFTCGTGVNFTSAAREVIGTLCFECGERFATPKKESHLASKHPKTNMKGAATCRICKYQQRKPKKHTITVKEPLNVPDDYPEAEPKAALAEDDVPDRAELGIAHGGDLMDGEAA